MLVNVFVYQVFAYRVHIIYGAVHTIYLVLLYLLRDNGGVYGAIIIMY